MEEEGQQQQQVEAVGKYGEERSLPGETGARRPTSAASGSTSCGRRREVLPSVWSPAAVTRECNVTTNAMACDSQPDSSELTLALVPLPCSYMKSTHELYLKKLPSYVPQVSPRARTTSCMKGR